MTEFPQESNWAGLLGILQGSQVQTSTAHKIPFTVVTGFLGSGKTTFINELIEATNLRLAILVNDFGEINIDASLIRNKSDSMIELTNGCVCCSIAAGLCQSLHDLLNSPILPDYIILETSGIAELSSIILTVASIDGLYLAGNLCMVDAERFVDDIGNSQYSDILKNQILNSDFACLRKLDVVQRSHIDEVAKTLRTIDQSIRILHDSPAACFSCLSQSNSAMPNIGNITPTKEHANKWFKSITLQTCGTLSSTKLADFARNMPKSVLRAKGLVWIATLSRPVVYQQIGKRWSFSPTEALNETRDTFTKLNQIIIIGQWQDDSDPTLVLADRFHACAA